jgi:hypothetical protein
MEEVRAGSNDRSELGGAAHRECGSVVVLRPISMARWRLPVLELLHRVEGKVVEEAGAQAWMRGKCGGKKGDGALAGGSSSGSVAWGREGKGEGGLRAQPHGGGGREGPWRGGRHRGAASNGPQSSGVGGGVAT